MTTEEAAEFRSSGGYDIGGGPPQDGPETGQTRRRLKKGRLPAGRRVPGATRAGNVRSDDGLAEKGKGLWVKMGRGDRPGRQAF